MSAVFQEHPKVIIERPKLLKCYKKHMLSFLRSKYPNQSPADLLKLINESISQNFKDRKATVISYPEQGSYSLDTVDLSGFVENHRKDLIAPSGTVFRSSPDYVPPSVEYNNDCRLDRKKYKKMMFACFEAGDMFGYDLNDKKQQLRKIKNNSIIGAHGFEGNPLYDKESFGAITSLGRNNVILTYTLTEQCLSNNFYWDSKDKIIDYVITLIEHAPSVDTISRLLEKHPLYIPKISQVVDRLTESAYYYMPSGDVNDAKQMLTSILSSRTREEILYVFYRRNLLNMFSFNDSIFRAFFFRLFNVDTDFTITLPTSIPEDVLALPGDVLMMIGIVYDHILQGKAVNKDLVKDHPETASKLASIGKVVVSILEEMDEILSPFMYTGELPAQITDNRRILRKSVAVSDTDSILFTMKDPVSWYLKGDYRVTKEGINLSAYIVLILSRILNVANQDLIIAKGSIGDNIERINLKSEFFYAVFIKTDLGKHYISEYISKEGRMQASPKLDIKGVELQSSTLPQVSRDFAKTVMKDTLNTIFKDGSISGIDLVKKCMDYEVEIIESLKHGSLDYYSNVSIKTHATEYKDAEKSIWFNYSVWQEIFAPVYGPIITPGKFPLVPFRKNIFRTEYFFSWIKQHDVKMYDRLVKFTSKLPKNKCISRLPLPNELGSLPKILLPAVDMRSIVYKNVKPVQLFMKQLGLDAGKQKNQPLFLDHYEGTDSDVLASFMSGNM